eukprot:GHVU01018696.1.p1 GENE.GHVU01018696.1~~GHVU01018696.1.p1  ORF type:complete len:110 (-),score=19.55 GHVU01018696.1:86-415(-)
MGVVPMPSYGFRAPLRTFVTSVVFPPRVFDASALSCGGDGGTHPLGVAAGAWRSPAHVRSRLEGSALAGNTGRRGGGGGGGVEGGPFDDFFPGQVFSLSLKTRKSWLTT